MVHTWVTENWQTFDNVNAVLIADPKRAAGPGSAGAAAHPLVAPVVGAPLSGADNFFGNVPVLTLCTDDIICDANASSGLPGYLWEGKHGNYNFNVDVYTDDARGQWFNGSTSPETYLTTGSAPPRHRTRGLDHAQVHYLTARHLLSLAHTGMVRWG